MAKNNNIPKPEMVDVLVKKVPYKLYLEMKAENEARGYSVQGFEVDYYQTSDKRIT